MTGAKRPPVLLLTCNRSARGQAQGVISWKLMLSRVLSESLSRRRASVLDVGRPIRGTRCPIRGTLDLLQAVLQCQADCDAALHEAGQVPWPVGILVVKPGASTGGCYRSAA